MNDDNDKRRREFEQLKKDIPQASENFEMLSREYAADADAPPIDRFLMQLAQGLHDSGDTEMAERLAVNCAVLRETWKEALGTPYAYHAHDKLESIRDAAQSAMEIIEFATRRKIS